MLKRLFYRRAAPADVGFQDVIFPDGERPQVSQFGIGGRPTDGQLTAIPGGIAIGYQSILTGLPKSVPVPGAGQWLYQR